MTWGELAGYWPFILGLMLTGAVSGLFAGLLGIGGGAIIMTAGENLVAIALAHGLAIGLMIAAAGHISGGVYNPALTVGLVATGRMPLNRGILYIVAQLAGAVVAALALKAIYDTSQVDAVNLGTPMVGARYEVSAALLAEIARVMDGAERSTAGPAERAG